MSQDKFRSEFAELLDLDPNNLTETLNLKENNWDSLAIISTIALLDEHFSISIEGKSLSRCSTFGDLEQLIQNRIQSRN